MKTVLLFCFSDLGKNERLIRHATKLINQKNAKVICVGFDITDIPSDFLKLPRLSVRYIFPFFHIPFLLTVFLWPIQFIFYLIQMIGIAVNTPSIDLIISSSSFYFTETFCGYIISLIKSAKLVFDISSFFSFEAALPRFISKKMFKLADFLTCPTHSMEKILQLGGLRSFLCPNEPDHSFKPNGDMRKQVCELINVDQSSKLIAVPIPTFDSESLRSLADAANFVKKSNELVCFIIFGNGKFQKAFSDNIKSLNINNVKFHFCPFQYDIYPMLLSACDLGVIFTDPNFVMEIPPQLLNIAGCGIPIVTFRYGCVGEIVKNNINGLILDNNSELGPTLKKIFVEKMVDLNNMRNKNEEIKTNADELWILAFQKIL